MIQEQPPPWPKPDAEIPWEPVQSSWASHVAHQGNVLFVRYNSGAEFSYDDVSSDEYKALRGSPSIGKSLRPLIASKDGRQLNKPVPPKQDDSTTQAAYPEEHPLAGIPGIEKS